MNLMNINQSACILVELINLLQKNSFFHLTNNTFEEYVHVHDQVQVCCPTSVAGFQAQFLSLGLLYGVLAKTSAYLVY